MPLDAAFLTLFGAHNIYCNFGTSRTPSFGESGKLFRVFTSYTEYLYEISKEDRKWVRIVSFVRNTPSNYLALSSSKSDKRTTKLISGDTMNFWAFNCLWNHIKYIRIEFSGSPRGENEMYKTYKCGVCHQHANCQVSYIQYRQSTRWISVDQFFIWKKCDDPNQYVT